MIVIIIVGACCAGSPADIDGDGVVNGSDLNILLEQWGNHGSADIDADGVVDSKDLRVLLEEWT